eukprot:CAMPEP_0194443014 /NCGR_PEP_ID=MMETSP0176-20130528/126461_1 /TAXON_ID=216777 /ORGANISM="Proboscia alata, Strain PI-D3" /LENGTH=232 /DNA_ID=CAMNT_0039269197 /DNA_START=95 /DNA_END=790 /DNA_ORIENTATION=+
MKTKSTSVLLFTTICTLCRADVESDLKAEQEEIWEHGGYTVDEIWDEFDCDEIYEEPRQPLNEFDWIALRGVYRGIVGPIHSTIGISHVNPFSKKVKVVHIDGKGRGVIAQEPILKGEHVWTGKLYTATFDDEDDFQKFLASIRVDIACDVIHWMYIENFEDEYYISVDLDDGSFINNAGPSWGVEPNIVDSPADNSSIRDNSSNLMFAIKDIAVGEELLCDYSDFDQKEGW